MHFFQNFACKVRIWIPGRAGGGGGNFAMDLRWIFNGFSTDFQRIFNGFSTDLRWICNAPSDGFPTAVEIAFSAENGSWGAFGSSGRNSQRRRKIDAKMLVPYWKLGVFGLS